VCQLLAPQEDDTSEQLQPFLDILAASPTLCRVKLARGEGYEVLTSRLLEAIALNANITELNVLEKLNPCPEAFCRFLGTCFIRKMRVCIRAFEHHESDIQALLPFGWNQHLRELHIVDEKILRG
jgi:hypothetical protein